MNIYKFGGASLRNADGVRNITSIIGRHGAQELLVVVSAMGKSTNALEDIVFRYQSGDHYDATINELANFHYHLIDELFENPLDARGKVEAQFQLLESSLTAGKTADQLYDEVVSYGELISSIIVNCYLTECAVASSWVDAREYICTDNTYREGKIDWDTSTNEIKKLQSVLTQSIILTQGFIGRAPDGTTTTLGREGSDFSAAIFGACLNARSVTIWKDVPGVMSADPKRFANAVVFPELPYKEAAEMTYYGANVIHPKTIKPLANKNIPLLVKNFIDPTLPGTIIHACNINNLPPLIIFKENQCLISCKVIDYTFINEQQLSVLFHAVADLDVHINVMQNSAISFSFCIDFRSDKIAQLIARLQEHFEVFYNINLTLITVKNYDHDTFEHYRNLPGLLMQQSSRATLRVLVKSGY